MNLISFCLLQMLRATIICCLLGSMLHPSVQGAQVDARNARQFHQQAQVQQQQYAVPQERQGLGGNFDVTTPFGTVQGGANLGVPQGNGLLTNAVIALGVLSLVNTVATVASGWFGNKDTEDDKDKEDGNYDLFVIASKALLKKSFIIMIGKFFESVISSVL
jgi:hypothetical protein